MLTSNYTWMVAIPQDFVERAVNDLHYRAKQGLAFIGVLLLAMSLMTVNASAQRGGGGGGTSTEYVEISQIDEASISSRLNGIQVLDSSSPLGDTVNMDMGSLSFSHTDVNIPGNSPLPVSFGRSYAVDGADIADNIYGGWNPEVPYITAKITLSDRYGPGMTWRGNDCMRPPNRVTQGEAGSEEALRSANAFWQGVSMHIPGEGDKLILSGIHPTPSSVGGISLNQGTSQNVGPIFASGPSGGTPLLRTQDHWVLTCLGSSDVGAVAHAPNGWKYYFDHVTLTRAGDRNLLRLLTSTDSRGVPYQCSNAGPRSNCLSFSSQNVDNLNVMATRVEDQNGNWVEYDYDGMRLKNITSNDGRRVDFTYENVSYSTTNSRDKSGVRLKTISANGRSWTFNYSITGVYSHLEKITLPDDRTWEFDLPPMKVKAESYVCYRINRGGVDPKTFTVKGPSGLLATYNLELRRFGKSGVPKSDLFPAPTGFPTYSESCDDNKIPKFSISRALVSKTYDVPSGDEDTWQYEYQNDEGHFASAGLSGPTYDLRRSEVIDPEGNSTVAYYNRRFQSDDEGLVNRREYYDGTTGALLETTRIEYEKGPAMGSSTVLFTFAPPLTHSRPVKKTTIQRDGDTFTQETNYNFNTSSSAYSYGRPVETRSYSNVSTSPRITDITYEHNLGKWILGLPSRMVRNGLEMSTYVYDSLGRKTSQTRYGAPYATFTYHTWHLSKGALFSVTDALGRRSELREYKRGTAQRILSAVGTPEQTEKFQLVDDNGWLTSQRDVLARTTRYKHDIMGRLTQIDPHGAWANTDITYDFTGGGAVQTITKGDAKTTVNYDGMYRTVLERTQDLSSNWSSYVNTRYDALGRAVFSSQPSTSTTETKGATSSYDGLGRMLETRETVAPFATTRYSYHNSHRRRMTDPSGAITDYFSYGWDGPGSEDLRQIRNFSDGAFQRYTVLTKNVHGRLLRVAQSGQQGGVTANKTQYFYYDDEQRLCRHYVLEHGATKYQYDAAGQMSAYAKGQGNSGCGTVPNGSAKVNLTYDNLGRVTNTNFTAENTPDITRTYDANGNVLSVNRGNGTKAVNWAYTYNDADLLTAEALTVDGRSFPMSYGYNNQGYMTHRNLPSGRRVNYTPDGLGRLTGVESGGTTLASGTSFHASGAITAMNYGNGHNFTQTLNARLLPARMRATKGSTSALDLAYSYTPRGKISAITDRGLAGNNRAFTYDGLGQLKTASGPWGAGAYNYDSLGNILSKTEGSRTVNLTYDTRNRLTRSADTGATGTRTVAYDVRGNVTTLGSMGFIYDYADQPVTVSGSANGVNGASGASNGNYTYDGNLKRVKSVVNGKTIYNVYDAGGALVHVYEYTDGQKKTDYISGPMGALARYANNTLTYTHNNHLGSAVSGTSASGAVLWRERYTPFGEEMTGNAVNDNQAGFTGHIKDSATGLNYMQARYYDPVIGRFLSVDPMTMFDADMHPGMFNRYAYTLNDPINLTDPTGMCAEDGKSGICGNDPDATKAIETQLKDKNSITGPVEAAAIEAGVRIGVNSGAKKSRAKPGVGGDVATIDLASSDTMTVLNDNGTIESVIAPLTEVLEHEVGHIADGIGIEPVGESDIVTSSQFKEKPTRKGVSESSSINRTNIYRRKSKQTRQRYCHTCSPSEARRHHSRKTP